MAKVVKVLSIDGGGIRGIIPAMVLAEIEKSTGKRIAELFDVIAGTSTGGILALALIKPDAQGKPEYTANNLIKLYKDEGKKIFKTEIFNRVKMLADEKYPNRNIEDVLQKYFGGTPLSKALTNVVITSYDLKVRDTYLFKSSKAKEAPSKRDFKMKDVARATSAAPTYFEPHLVKLPDNSRTLVLVDGGVFANNPAMCAYVEAKTLYKDATDFLVVSIGTGQLTNELKYEEVKDWGLVEWAQPILNVVLDGVSDVVDYHMNELLQGEDGTSSYYRFQIDLDKDRGDRMDDASDENINYLQNKVNRDILGKVEYQNKLKKLCELLQRL